MNVLFLTAFTSGNSVAITGISIVGTVRFLNDLTKLNMHTCIQVVQ